MTCLRGGSDYICVLEAQCKKKDLSSTCVFPGHYETLTTKLDDPSLVKNVKDRMREGFNRSWAEFVQNPMPGNKSMTGGAFEKAIREVISEALEPLGVTVSRTGKKLGKEGMTDLCGNVDCLIKKDGYPTSIVSAKTWLGMEQLRETFATAYFAKFYYGQKSVRVYMVVFTPFSHNLNWERACMPYIDGIYGLAPKGASEGFHYIDDLLKELRNTYEVGPSLGQNTCQIRVES